MTDGYVWGRVAGEALVSEQVTYDIDTVEHDDGAAVSIEVRFSVGGLSLIIDFGLEQADVFLREFRDEVVRAKRAKLEWRTDTGVSEDRE